MLCLQAGVIPTFIQQSVSDKIGRGHTSQLSAAEATMGMFFYKECKQRQFKFRSSSETKGNQM